VIAQRYGRRRHEEFLRFLKLIDSAAPKDLDVHLVPDTTPPTRPPRSRRGWGQFVREAAGLANGQMRFVVHDCA
jgi:hypothetical protein